MSYHYWTIQMRSLTTRKKNPRSYQTTNRSRKRSRYRHHCPNHHHPRRRHRHYYCHRHLMMIHR